MQSVPLAMAWEFWRKGRWQFLLALAAVVALPTLIYSAVRLSSMNQVDLRQEGFYNFYFAWLLVQAIAFGAAMLMSQENISQFYAWPVSTSTIVTWRLIPGMAALAILHAVVTISINLMFNVGWPLVGPALFLACIYPVFQAAMWIGEKAPAIQIVLVSTAAAVAGVWLRARHGALSGQPSRYWTDVTNNELLTLLGVAWIGWYGAYVGLRRDRCGDNLRWLRFYDWLESFSRAGRLKAEPFRSPARAQFWFEWRQKGLLMPAVVIVGFGSMCLILFVRQVLIQRVNPEEFVVGIVLTGVVLPIIGLLVGMALGQSGTGRDKTVMGSFLASRPMEDAALSGTVLRVAALSTLLAWSIWAVAVLALSLLLRPGNLTGLTTGPSAHFFQNVWPQLLGPLPLTWIAAANAACIVQTGRIRLMSQILAGLFLLLVGWLFLSGPVWHLGSLSIAVPLFVFGVGSFVGTVAAFVRALICRLIAPQTAWFSLLAWIVACLAIDSILRAANRIDAGPMISIICCALLALAVAPLAAGPLAIAWNRHR
jgi:hypothetical protein